MMINRMVVNRAGRYRLIRPSGPGSSIRYAAFGSRQTSWRQSRVSWPRHAPSPPVRYYGRAPTLGLMVDLWLELCSSTGGREQA